MNQNNPLGVKVIASYFFLKAGVLLSASAIGYLRPELREGANEFISHGASFVKQFDMVKYGIALAPLLAVYETVMGLGFWFLKRWARLLVLVNIYYYFGRGIMGLLLLWEINPKTAHPIMSSPYFMVALILNIVFLLYLIDSDVKRAFKIPDNNAW